MEWITLNPKLQRQILMAMSAGGLLIDFLPYFRRRESSGHPQDVLRPKLSLFLHYLVPQTQIENLLHLGE